MPAADDPRDDRPENQPGDASSSPELVLLQRAELALATLEKRAEIARVEARRAELQAAMVDARNGQPARLQTLLEELGSGIPGPWPEKSAAQPNPIDWNVLLPAAINRLQQRREQRTLTATRLTEPKIPAAGKTHQPRQVATNLGRDQKSPRATAARAVAPATKQDSQAPTGKRSDASQRSNRLAVAATLQRKQDDQDQPKWTSWIPGASGATASLLFHIFLAAVLTLVTLQLPADPDSLAIQATATSNTSETFEISQPVDTPDAAEPAEASVPSLTSDPTQAISDLNQQLSSSLLDEGSSSRIDMASKVTAATSVSNIPTAAASSFFGAAATGNSFCYVIDGSGSMRGGPWQAAKGELLRSLGSLKPKQRFYIIVINRTPTPIRGRGSTEPARSLLYATPENLEHARRWLETIEIGSGAPPSKSLEMAIELEPDAIYLLTDGVTRADVAEFLRSANRVSDFVRGEQVRVPIHTIAFYSREGIPLLQQIAQENLGQFVHVPKTQRH